MCCFVCELVEICSFDYRASVTASPVSIQNEDSNSQGSLSMPLPGTLPAPIPMPLLAPAIPGAPIPPMGQIPMPGMGNEKLFFFLK